VRLRDSDTKFRDGPLHVPSRTNGKSRLHSLTRAVTLTFLSQSSIDRPLFSSVKPLVRQPLRLHYDWTVSCPFCFHHLFGLDAMTSHSTSHVKKLLTTLRDTPADTAGASDEVLRDVYLYLMNASSSAQGNIHWFCDKADPTVIEAATFLIRLMAYRSDEVTKWKLKLHQCLSGCAMCVQGFEKVKVTSRLTYVLLCGQSIGPV